MYRHSITVYDRSYRLVKTISDRVDLQALGGPAADGPVRGAPVEAAFSPDARYAYVSNGTVALSRNAPGKPSNVEALLHRRTHEGVEPVDRAMICRL